MATEPNPLGGRCLNFFGVPTREELHALGLSDAPADEIIAFAKRLEAKYAPPTDPPATSTPSTET